MASLLAGQRRNAQARARAQQASSPSMLDALALVGAQRRQAAAQKKQAAQAQKRYVQGQVYAAKQANPQKGKARRQAVKAARRGARQQVKQGAAPYQQAQPGIPDPSQQYGDPSQYYDDGSGYGGGGITINVNGTMGDAAGGGLPSGPPAFKGPQQADATDMSQTNIAQRIGDLV